jgi:hypothetical protein
MFVLNYAFSNDFGLPLIPLQVSTQNLKRPPCPRVHHLPLSVEELYGEPARDRLKKSQSRSAHTALGLTVNASEMNLTGRARD